MNATTNAVPPLFLACCRDTLHGYDLSRPWSADGWLCATDGRILVRARCEAIGVDPADFTPTTPVWETEHLFRGPWSDEEFPIPDPGEPVWERCTICDNTGWCRPCPTCMAAGVADSCSTCHDEAVVGADSGEKDVFRCDDCDGYAPWEIARPVPIGSETGRTPPWAISSVYARLLRAHSVATIRVPTQWNRPAYFRLGAIDGVVMGMRTEQGGEDRRWRVIRPRAH